MTAVRGRGQFLDSIFSGVAQDHPAEVNAANSNYPAYMPDQTNQHVNRYELNFTAGSTTQLMEAYGKSVAAA